MSEFGSAAEYFESVDPSSTATPAPEATATPEPPAQESAPAESGDEAFDANATQFPRDYVEKLRRESAGYRDRAKRYGSAFDGYEDAAVEEWLGLVSSFREDPKNAAAAMADFAKGVLDQYGEELEQGEVEPAPEGDDVPMTLAQYKEMREAETAEITRAQGIAKVESEARQLGYDLASRDYKMLLITANELPDGSITKAHAILEGERQKIIDGYVAQRRADAGTPLPPNSGTTPSGETPVRSFDDAKAGVMSMLEAQRNQW